MKALHGALLVLIAVTLASFFVAVGSLPQPAVADAGAQELVVADLPAVAPAEHSADGTGDSEPVWMKWWVIFSSIVGTAAVIAKYTPTKRDDTIVGYLTRLLDLVGFQKAPPRNGSRRE